MWLLSLQRCLGTIHDFTRPGWINWAERWCWCCEMLIQFSFHCRCYPIQFDAVFQGVRLEESYVAPKCSPSRLDSTLVGNGNGSIISMMFKQGGTSYRALPLADGQAARSYWAIPSEKIFMMVAADLLVVLQSWSQWWWCSAYDESYHDFDSKIHHDGFRQQAWTLYDLSCWYHADVMLMAK